MRKAILAVFLISFLMIIPSGFAITSDSKTLLENLNYPQWVIDYIDEQYPNEIARAEMYEYDSIIDINYDGVDDYVVVLGSSLSFGFNIVDGKTKEFMWDNTKFCGENNKLCHNHLTAYPTYRVYDVPVLFKDVNNDRYLDIISMSNTAIIPIYSGKDGSVLWRIVLDHRVGSIYLKNNYLVVGTYMRSPCEVRVYDLTTRENIVKYTHYGENCGPAWMEDLNNDGFPEIIFNRFTRDIQLPINIEMDSTVVLDANGNFFKEYDSVYLPYGAVVYNSSLIPAKNLPTISCLFCTSKAEKMWCDQCPSTTGILIILGGLVLIFIIGCILIKTSKKKRKRRKRWN